MYFGKCYVDADYQPAEPDLNVEEDITINEIDNELGANIPGDDLSKPMIEEIKELLYKEIENKREGF